MLVPSASADSDSSSCSLPPADIAFGRVGLANRRSFVSFDVASTTGSTTFLTGLTLLTSFVPALAASFGAASAFGSASSLAIDSLLCVFSFGTGTCDATFFRPAYV